MSFSTSNPANDGLSPRERALQQVEWLRGEESTYTSPLQKTASTGSLDMKTFLTQFYQTIWTDEKRAWMEQEQETYPELKKHYQKLVVVEERVPHECFWQRYEYRCDLPRVMYTILQQDNAEMLKTTTLKIEDANHTSFVVEEEADMSVSSSAEEMKDVEPSTNPHGGEAPVTVDAERMRSPSTVVIRNNSNGSLVPMGTAASEDDVLACKKLFLDGDQKAQEMKDPTEKKSTEPSQDRGRIEEGSSTPEAPSAVQSKSEDQPKHVIAESGRKEEGNGYVPASTVECSEEHPLDERSSEVEETGVLVGQETAMNDEYALNDVDTPFVESMKCMAITEDKLSDALIVDESPKGTTETMYPVAEVDAAAADVDASTAVEPAVDEITVITSNKEEFPEEVATHNIPNVDENAHDDIYSSDNAADNSDGPVIQISEFASSKAADEQADSRDMAEVAAGYSVQIEESNNDAGKRKFSMEEKAIEKTMAAEVATETDAGGPQKRVMDSRGASNGSAPESLETLPKQNETAIETTIVKEHDQIPKIHYEEEEKKEDAKLSFEDEITVLDVDLMAVPECKLEAKMGDLDNGAAAAENQTNNGRSVPYQEGRNFSPDVNKYAQLDSKIRVSLTLGKLCKYAALFLVVVAPMTASMWIRSSTAAGDSLCSPIRPGEHMTDQNLADADHYFSAPWWAPERLKEQSFNMLCYPQGRVRTELQVSKSKQGLLTVVGFDQDKDTKIPVAEWKKVRSFQVALEGLEVQAERTGGKLESEPAPWKRRDYSLVSGWGKFIIWGITAGYCYCQM